MADEDLFAQAIAAAMLEEEADDDRWVRLAEGRLSASERAELEAAATSDPDIAARLALYAPSSPLEQQVLVARAERAQRRPVARWVASGSAAMAAAAALALWIAPAPADNLFAYHAEHQLGDAPTRGASAAPLAPVHPRSLLELRLRPERAVSGPLEARVYRLAAGSLEPLDLSPELSEHGAARVRVQAGVVASDGPARLVLVVARPGHLPAPDALRDALELQPSPSGTGWSATSLAVSLDGPP